MNVTWQSSGTSSPLRVENVCQNTCNMCMSTYLAHTPRQLREGLVEFIRASDYSHALTLNTDRELTLPRLRSIFSNLCMNVDRRIHDRQRMSLIPPSMRFKAIAFPEHLNTNAHLHVSADLRPLESKFPLGIGLLSFLEDAWLKATRGAGSVHMQPITSDTWAWYQTKEAQTSDPTYFLAADFHSHR